MKKQMSYYLQQLENSGIDTSCFNLECNGVVLKIEDLIQKYVDVTNVELKNKINVSDIKIVQDKFVALLDKNIPNTYIHTSSDLFRKFGCLCLNWRNQETRNKKHQIEKGFDAYVRNELTYMYQFEFINSYIKPSNGSFYEVAKKFFTRDVLMELCKHAIKKAEKSNRRQGCSLNELYALYNNFDSADYECAFQILTKFLYHLDNIWVHEFKCPAWKDAFKGLMNFCAIDYLIKKGVITSMTLNELQDLLNNEEFMETPYKFYQLLNDLIEGKN